MRAQNLWFKLDFILGFLLSQVSETKLCAECIKFRSKDQIFGQLWFIFNWDFEIRLFTLIFFENFSSYMIHIAWKIL